MYDGDLAKEILSQILKALDTVIYRFAPIKSLADLTDSPSGMEKLDAICMQLIAIGEGLENLEKIGCNSLVSVCVFILGGALKLKKGVSYLLFIPFYIFGGTPAEFESPRGGFR